MGNIPIKSSSFQELNELRIPYESMLAATNNFDPGNIIHKTLHNNYVYRGDLLWLRKRINVIVQRTECTTEDEILKMVSVLSRFKHKNIATFVGFCYRYGDSYIVTEGEVQGSLDQILNIVDVPSSSSKKNLVVHKVLTCSQRLKICLGAARALRHIHEWGAVHGVFMTNKILLDENFEAKVVGWVISYTDSDTLNKSLGPKSDVYSFGMVLIDLFCHEYAKLLRCGGDTELSGIDNTHFDNNIRKQIHSQALAILLESLNKCLNGQGEQRPSMDEVVKLLDRAFILQGYQERSFGLEYIKSATKNFSETYLIGSGGYGNVYKAELDIFDENTFLKIKGKKPEGTYMKRITVAIKQIKSDEKGHGEHGFFIEVDMLSKCEHPNIVSLLGYCNEDSELILVYEFVPNGSLEDYLIGINAKIYLNWVQRIKICLNIASGLDYLHTKFSEKKKIIHRDIKSANILLDENWEAKIADFGLSKFSHLNRSRSTMITNTIAGTDFYLDPEYMKTGKLKKECDIYSLGVVLFEILSGRLANDSIYCAENVKGLASVARKRFNEGTLNDIIDPKLLEEAEEIHGVNIVANQESLKVFAKIAFRCLAKTQDRRPTIKVIIKRLQTALNLQNHGANITVNRNDKKIEDFKIPLDEINLAIGVKDQDTCVGEGGFGVVYRGKLSERWLNRKVAIKFQKPKGDEEQMEINFRSELGMIFNFNHQNVIPFIGYCDEGNEKITVHDFAENGSLDDYLLIEDNRRCLTWAQRLRICLGAARGLNYLHSGLGEDKRVIHRDVKSGNILLDDNLEPKICDFELSISDSTIGQPYAHAYTHIAGTNFYIDPVYHEGGVLRKESDVYSFGVVMFELLSGMLVYNYRSFEDGKPPQSLLHHVRRYYDHRPELLIDPFIRDEINTLSFNAFKSTAIQCISFNSKERPTMDLIVDLLEEALDLQVNGIST
ncbi:receptor like protein kinase S.2-like [Rutidosis leptorrhynchoides]|uniref:receptor like protein kinase S.2-like n=1 Tax=Rutidosis leptorrhynchoides TaxID=125765 RepID=UPI003A98E190